MVTIYFCIYRCMCRGSLPVVEDESVLLRASFNGSLQSRREDGKSEPSKVQPLLKVLKERQSAWRFVALENSSKIAPIFMTRKFVIRTYVHHNKWRVKSSFASKGLTVVYGESVQIRVIVDVGHDKETGKANQARSNHCCRSLEKAVRLKVRSKR